MGSSHLVVTWYNRLACFPLKGLVVTSVEMEGCRLVWPEAVSYSLGCRCGLAALQALCVHSPSVDSVGSWHAKAELHGNHSHNRDSITSGGVHRIPELSRNRVESVGHSGMSGAQQACSLQTAGWISDHVTLQLRECRKSET